ncbi:MAG: DUF3098 domain-containing protein [Candidatus Kapabacteria bacterium]|jgi:hypothetical protein|nr:DUF3098 domain-containing protein [Candidatus Kapabacteria bacterium]
MAKNKKNSAGSLSGTKVSNLQDWKFPLEKQNMMLFGLGLVVILIGYALMMTGLGSDYAGVDAKWNNPLAVNVAPIVLVLGYCVIIPYSIYRHFDKSNSEQN